MLSEIYWDEFNRVEVRNVATPAAIDFSTDDEIQYVIESDIIDGLPINVLYVPDDSETLVVSFHGSLQRTKYQLPRFEWRNTLTRLKAGRLMVADSTLRLSPSMPLGWFVGTATQDLSADIANVIQQIAALGGYSRIVLTGSSGGGYAAMAVSHQIPGSLAVSFSPQTRIGDYSGWVHKAFVAAAFPQYNSIEEVEHAVPKRVNLRDLYVDRGANFVQYIQNINDIGHYENQYVPFARMLNVDPSRGGIDSTGSVCLVPEEMQVGHHPPSRGRFIRHIDESHRIVFGEQISKKF